MQDVAFGAAVRLARLRRGWRQQDLADRAKTSRSAVSRIERGLLEDVPWPWPRRVCAPLEIRVELQPRGRGGDLDRMINERHSALHESVARSLANAFPDWVMAHEVSFNVFGERGVVDMILWHPARRPLLIIELKTELVELGLLLATVDRRRRLAADIVMDCGSETQAVSSWVIVARSRTTERRIAEHRTMLRSAVPDTQRRIDAWLGDPIGAVNGLSLWQMGASETAPTYRVRRPMR
jgi:hypothetical protein